MLRDGRARPKDVVTKGRTEITTWADAVAQDAIVEVIAAAFPGHRIEGKKESSAASTPT